MAKLKFTEPQLFLLRKWADVHSLEIEMCKARKTYKAIFNEVLDRINAKYKKLDRRVVKCDERPESDSPEDLGYVNVGIGKTEWPSWNSKTWPTGFWIGGILLEELHSQNGEPPHASVFINPPKTSLLNLEDARTRLIDEVKKSWKQGDEGIVDEIDQKENYISLAYPLPEQREELLDLLLKNESCGFIECMTKHFENLIKLTDVIDDIFVSSKPKKRTSR